MGFGLYIHIPYCIQKCHYCDFATVPMDHATKMATYTQLILQEIDSRHDEIEKRTVTSIYFGGGTPSLLPPDDILTILRKIHNVGFQFSPDIEITLEINPGTIDPQRLDVYRGAGVNRFSVGVQTFNDDLLRACGREHSSADTRTTLKLLRDAQLNYTVDLLFGLPNQTLEMVQADLKEFLAFDPPHLSAYCLTVPEKHPMNRGRAPDQEQAEMFEFIQSFLATHGILRYEISNYAKPGKESRHNRLYWTDQPYWGLGLSAHSYLPSVRSNFGVRFWNPPTMRLYESQIRTLTSTFLDRLPSNQVEHLQIHEALTDFCHTQLRLLQGLDLSLLERKFGPISEVEKRIETALKKGLIERRQNGVVALSVLGRQLANQSFLEFTFLPEELNS